MGKNQDNKTEYDLDRLLQSSFGYDDDQLLEEMRLAEETIDDSQIPPASEDGFARLLAECERRKIVPHSENKENRENDDIKSLEPLEIVDGNKDALDGEKKRKIRRIGPLVRIAIAVAVLATVLVFTGIQAGAKKQYEYSKRIRYSENSNIVLNNETMMQEEGKLKKAYDEIHNQMGIQVLRFGYIPDGMQYITTTIENGQAVSYFDYKGESITLVQQIKTSGNSTNIVSDRAENIIVQNDWLGQDIEIGKALTDDGKEELSTVIVIGSAFYYVSGIVGEEEMKKIVEDLRLTD